MASLPEDSGAQLTMIEVRLALCVLKWHTGEINSFNWQRIAAEGHYASEKSAKDQFRKIKRKLMAKIAADAKNKNGCNTAAAKGTPGADNDDDASAKGESATPKARAKPGPKPGNKRKATNDVENEDSPKTPKTPTKRGRAKKAVKIDEDEPAKSDTGNMASGEVSDGEAKSAKPQVKRTKAAKKILDNDGKGTGEKKPKQASKRAKASKTADKDIAGTEKPPVKQQTKRGKAKLPNKVVSVKDDESEASNNDNDESADCQASPQDSFGDEEGTITIATTGEAFSHDESPMTIEHDDNNSDGNDRDDTVEDIGRTSPINSENGDSNEDEPDTKDGEVNHLAADNTDLEPEPEVTQSIKVDKGKKKMIEVSDYENGEYGESIVVATGPRVYACDEIA